MEREGLSLFISILHLIRCARPLKKRQAGPEAVVSAPFILSEETVSNEALISTYKHTNLYFPISLLFYIKE